MEVNKWWISDEIRYGWKFVHSEDRLVSPVRQQLGGPVESDWNHTLHDAANGLKKAAQDGGTGSLAVVVSPMLAIEEAFLLGKLARAIDKDALLIVGPIPKSGEDKSFPGGYTVYAEKCPNSRGVRRALEQVAGSAGEVHSFDDGMAKISAEETKVKAIVITGNYPSQWTTKEMVASVKGKFTVVIDTLPNDLTAKADVLLPGATWAEKSGMFENATGKLQPFSQAIAVLEGTRPEGQIALDLMVACGLSQPSRYDAETIRTQIGGDIALATAHNCACHEVEPDMQYLEL